MTYIINKGKLDNFIVFEVFNNSKGNSLKKYTKALKKLVNTNMIISDIKITKEVNLSESFFNTIQERSQYLNKKENALFSNLKGDFVDIDGENYFNGYYNDPLKEVSPVRVDLLSYTQTINLHRFIENNNREERYSNQSVLNNKNTFLLYPLRVVIDEIVTYIDVRIIIYKHGYAILNFSTSTNEVDLDLFNEQLWDLDIDSAFLPSFMIELDKKKSNDGPMTFKKLGGCIKLNDAVDRYKKIVLKAIASDDVVSDSFHTFMVPKPDEFGKENSYEYKRNLYKVLHTPMLSMPSKKRVSDFFDNNLFEEKGFPNTYGNQHRIIYTVSKEHIERNNGTYSEEVWIEHLYEAFRGDYFFAIEKLMLRKITNWKYMNNFFAPSISARKLYKINLNKIHESRFESNQIFYKYGSAIELIDVLYKKCIDANIEKLLEENKKSILEVNNLRRNIIQSEVGVLTSILVVLFTSILSIPAITNTMEFFRIESELIVWSSYLLIQFLVLATVITTFRDKISTFWFNIFNFFTSFFRHWRAVHNTKKLLRKSKGKR